MGSERQRREGLRWRGGRRRGGCPLGDGPRDRLIRPARTILHREEQPPAHAAYTVEGQVATRPPELGRQNRTPHPRVHADDLSRDFLLRVNHAMAIRHQNRMQDAMAAGRISRRFLACFSRTPDPCRTICGDRKRNSYCPRALPPHPLPPPSRQKHR